MLRRHISPMRAGRVLATAMPRPFSTSSHRLTDVSTNALPTRKPVGAFRGGLVLSSLVLLAEWECLSNLLPAYSAFCWVLSPPVVPSTTTSWRNTECQTSSWQMIFTYVSYLLARSRTLYSSLYFSLFKLLHKSWTNTSPSWKPSWMSCRKRNEQPGFTCV